MIIPISFQLLAKQKSLHPRHRRNFRTPCHYGERREKMNIRQSARSSCEKNQNSVVGVSCFTRRRWKVAAPEYGAPNYFALTRLLNSTRGYPLCRTPITAGFFEPNWHQRVAMDLDILGCTAYHCLGLGFWTIILWFLGFIILY